MLELSEYSAQLARLITALGSDDFSAQMIRTLNALVSVDDATVLVYPRTRLPTIEYYQNQDTPGSSTLDMFVRGAFVLDPYYLAATRDRKFGFFRLAELAPVGFKDSEYYKSWYRNCGYQDECGYLIDIAEPVFVNIALGKTAPGTRFTQRELTALRAITPVVATLCRRHWQRQVSIPTPGAIDLRAQLHDALQEFGRSLLTEREAQVINLVLHGHSTKTLAQKLSISVETVKLHRKHAYAKLEIKSQAELFHLFLDSLMSAQNYAGGDALVAYLQPPAGSGR